MKLSEKFSKILDAQSKEQGDSSDSHPQSESSSPVPSPLMVGMSQDRVVASVTFARSAKYVDELLWVFGVLRKDGRITREQEEYLARNLGWRKSLVETVLANEQISAGIGNLLSALASRIEGSNNSDHASKGESRGA